MNLRDLNVGKELLADLGDGVIVSVLEADVEGIVAHDLALQGREDDTTGTKNEAIGCGWRRTQAKERLYQVWRAFGPAFFGDGGRLSFERVSFTFDLPEDLEKEHHETKEYRAGKGLGKWRETS